MDRILELLNRPERPLLVAIDGHSAAGKSTLAATLQNRLEASRPDKVTVVRADDFYRVMPEPLRATLGPEEGYEGYYDWQRLRAEVLEPLALSKTSRYRRYDWQTGTLGETGEVKPEGVVLVEGCYSSRPELRPYYHVILYIDAPESLRMIRQKERADDAAWVARWDAAEKHYFSKHPPASFAHHIVKKSPVSYGEVISEATS